MKLKHVQTGKIVSGTIIWKESPRKDDEHSFNGIISRRGPCVVWYDPQNNRWNEDFLNEYVGPHHEKQAAFIPV